VGPGETVTANIDGKATFENFLNSLIAIRDALDSNDVVTLRSESTNLNSGINEINLASTINGSRMRTIEAARERIEKSNIEFKALLSQKEEINMAEIVALLRNQENIYETVVSIASRTQSMMNLFESLR
jgi:flagellin-like hook-associated protein FlgL